MPDLREVFEMTTKQMGEPALDSWQEQERRHRRASRTRRHGAFAVAAVIVVVAVAVIFGTRGGRDTTTPANPQATVDPSEKTARDVATDFYDAFYSSNEDQAVSMLADGADVSGWGVDGIREFRLLMRFSEATGFWHILDSCEEAFSYAPGTVVRCTWDFHAIRSDEIGLGPYSGSYDEVTIRDGEIVDVSSYIEIAKFRRQMWNPFAEWISTNYPEDVEVMYKRDFSDYRLTMESIRLWEQHTQEYVRAVEDGTA